MPPTCDEPTASSVIPFPIRPAPAPAAAPVRFSKQARNALLALEYVAPVLVTWGACDDGAEWATIGPVNGGSVWFMVFPSAENMNVKDARFRVVRRCSTPAEVRVVLEPRLAALAARREA